MAPFLRGMSRRDAILILVGAFSMQLFSSFVPFDRASITMKLEHQFDSERFTQDGSQDLHNQDAESSPLSQVDLPPSSAQVPIEYAPELPETTIVSHAPGWTLFRDLYMANGTLFIVSSAPQSSFPELRYMTSTPLTAINSPENIAAREPTREHLDFLTPRRARRWWGGDVEHGERNRVWTVEGNTILQNDPNQFLDHYYHFVAELVLGIWAFWQGTFTPAWSYIDPTALPPRTDIIPGPIIAPREPIDIPQIDRLIFAHAFAEEWRDKPGFNGYFFRAAFPSIDIEEEYDWIDRVKSTSAPTGQTLTKAWHFPHLLLIDRSAAFRGGFCGLQNSRTAAEPVEKMRGEGRLAKNWWSDVRRKVMDFARAPADIMEATVTDVETGKEMTMPKKVVVTYISRQDVRRHLIQEDHELLVQSLQELVQRKNSDWVSGGTENGREWELNIIKPETMTKDEQVAVASRTTILLGVHGNGLTHLVLMAPSPISTVIEMLYPGGFAHDYEWTAKALGMKHFGIWNDTSFTEPNIPSVEYVEGFQGTSIPVYGPLVAKIIEDRVAGLL